MRSQLTRAVVIVTALLLPLGGQSLGTAVPAVAAGPPGPPGTATATVSDATSASVLWSPPSDTGGFPITSYTVTASPGGQSVSTTGATTATVTGMAEGVAETFTVTATSSAGTGPASAASAAVVPSTVPSAPSGVTGQPVDAGVAVAWAAPDDDGGQPVLGYSVTASPGGATATTTGATTATVPGLSNGTAYSFTVTARNAVGTGPASPASPAVTPVAVPGAPVSVVAVKGDQSAVVSWQAPTDLGSPALSAYVVRDSLDDQAVTVQAPATTATVSDLTNGVAYSFTVTAVNATGSGPTSAASAEVTPGSPGNPGGGGISFGAVSTLAGNGTATTAAGTGGAAGLKAPGAVAVSGGYIYTATADAVTRTQISTGVTSVLAGTPGGPGCADGASGSGSAFASPRQLAADTTYLYLASGCGVRVVTMATGATVTVRNSSDVTSVAAPGDGLLYVVNGYENVSALDPGSGSRTTIATMPAGSCGGGGHAQSLASSPTQLYVAIYELNCSYDRSNPRIVSVAVAAGHTVVDPVPGGRGLPSESPLVVAGSYLYTSTFVDGFGPRLLRVGLADGAQTIVAGSSTGFADGTTTDAAFAGITGLASDGTNTYVADGPNNRLRKVAPGSRLPSFQPDTNNHAAGVDAGILYTFVGTGAATTSTGTGTSAGVRSPLGLTAVGTNLYVSTADAITKVDLTTRAQTVLSGVPGTTGTTDGQTGASSAHASGDLSTDGYYLYASQGGVIRRTNLKTGATTGVATLLGYPLLHARMGPNGLLYADTGRDHRVVSVNPTTGEVIDLRLSVPTSACEGPDIDDLAVDATTIYVGGRGRSCGDYFDANSFVYAYSLADGHMTANLLIRGGEVDRPVRLAAVGDSLYVADWDATSLTYTVSRLPKSGGSPAVVAVTVPDIGAFASDGHRLYLTNPTNNFVYVVVAAATPFGDGGPRLPLENPGGLNPAELGCSACIGDPVDLDTGAFFTSITDLSVGAYGPPLAFARAYTTARAGQSGRLGYGWTDNLDMRLTVDSSGTSTDGLVTIRQENGSQVLFAPKGGGYAAAPRVIATLTRNADSTWTYTRGQRDRFAFDGTGRLTAITDHDRATTTLGYDGSGRLATVTDATGLTLTLGYDSGARVRTVTDPQQRTVTYGYDTAGTLATVTDVNGTNTGYGYDSSHRLTSITDRRGHTLTTVYTAGKVTKQTDLRGNSTTIAYGATQPSGYHTTTVTDPLGKKSTYSYIDGLLATRTAGAGTGVAGTWSYNYDPGTGAVTSTKDPLGNTTHGRFDSNGNPLSVTNARDYSSFFRYDGLQDAVYQRDPLRNEITHVYSSTGDLLSTSTTLTSTGQTQLRRVYYGDRRFPGLPTTTIDPTGCATTTSYDSHAYPIATRDCAGGLSSRTVNTLGWTLTATTPRGNAAGTAPGPYATTSSSFTGSGLPRTVTDGLGHATTVGYDANDEPTSVTDPDNHTTTTTYDNNGEPTVVTRADSTTVSTSYDADGNTTSRTDALGHTTSYGYDARNRLTTSTDPRSHVTSYGYDAAGRTTTVSRSGASAGATITLGYDPVGDLTSARYNDGTTPAVSYTYDLDGLLATMTDGTGTTRTLRDSLHRVTQVTNGAGAVIKIGYDLRDRVTALTYPNTKTAAYRYDDRARTATLTDWLGGSTTWTADPNGELASTAQPNGVSSTRGYDPADRLTSLRTTGPGAATVLAQGWMLSPASQPTALTTTGTAQGDGTYTYDTRNRLTADTTSGGTAGSYALDAADRITTLTAGATTSTLAYDTADRLTTSTPATGTATTYSHDPAGRRTTATTGATSTRYGYDAADRLTTLTPATGAGAGAATTFRYDGTGQRTASTTAANTTRFTWWGPLLLADTTNSYLYSPSGQLSEQITTAGAVSYDHLDALGSVRATTSASGTVTSTTAYTAYGTPVGATGTAPSPFGYAGQYTDPSGLQYDRARYYDPVTAQFLTRDPREQSTRTAYGYAAADPITLSDPSGRQSADTSLAGSLGNEAAGFGDRVTGGGTNDIRELFGLNSVIDKCSSAYAWGGRAGAIGQLGISLIGLGLPKLATSLGEEAAAVEVAPAAAEGGSNVLLDTSAVKAQAAARGLMKPGECAVICSTVQREAAEQGFSTAGLHEVADGTSATRRGQVAAQLRAFGAKTQGLENDATIGGTALERGIPLITGDRALWNAVTKLGGDARWFAPGS